MTTIITATADFGTWDLPGRPVLHLGVMPDVGDRIVNDGPPAILWGEVVSLTPVGGQPYIREAVLRWCAPPDDTDEGERTVGDLPPEGVMFPAVLCACKGGQS